jgi:hypothetical protein
VNLCLDAGVSRSMTADGPAKGGIRNQRNCVDPMLRRRAFGKNSLFPKSGAKYS